MKINISFRNLGELGQQLLRSTKALHISLVDSKNLLAQFTYEHAVNSMQNEPKSGRVYQRSNPPRLHQASAPGEAPAVDLGTFVASVKVQKTSHHNQPAKVGSDDFRAEWFEHGTSKMLARPWLWPATARAGADALTIMHREMRKQGL